MKKLLVLIALVLNACSTMNTKPALVYDTHTETIRGIPSECFDDNGIFDSNKGHDSLDCDNL